MIARYHRASWWEPADDRRVKCLLCPRACSIRAGKQGFCGVRKNIAGELVSVAYGHPAAVHVDPIEKKPLAEFMGGSRTFSLGTYGCNLGCSFCQNYHLSRGFYQDPPREEKVTPDQIIKLAIAQQCQSVAFTYNEPVVWAEYVMDIARLARDAGLATVLVSNGYVTKSAAEDLLPLIDAANIDMKGFSEDFYREMTGGELQDVLRVIKYFHSLDHHLELTNLVIPGKNDSPAMIDAFLNWVLMELGADLPLHFSAYHPDYKFTESPRTTSDTLYRIKERAEELGLSHIYLGNLGFGS